MNYEKRRQKANAANQKIRKAYKKITGKKLPKKIEVDEIKSVKKGGSPTNPRNKAFVPRSYNRHKGAK